MPSRQLAKSDGWKGQMVRMSQRNPCCRHVLMMMMMMMMILFTNPSARAGYDTRSIFEFRVFLLLDYLPHQGWRTLVWRTYLPIAGGRIIGFIPFPRVLVLCEMQSASSRIWTRVTMSISYDDNHYTMMMMMVCSCTIMAEGFRFMPLGLVRLRTFRLSTWVS